MSNFMDRLMGRKTNAAQSAKDRLKLVLVTDRTSISPEDLRNMQREILDIIRKYCRVKEEDVELKFEQRERENYLVADIPLATTRGAEAGSVRLETTMTVSTSAPPTVVIAEAGTDPEATRPMTIDTSQLEPPPLEKKLDEAEKAAEEGAKSAEEKPKTDA